MKASRLSPACIARSLVTVVALSIVQVITVPVLSNSANAYTQGTATNGSAYGGTGGSPTATNLNCTNGAVVAIGATKSGNNLNTFMFVCKTINSDASLSATDVTTNVMGAPSESDRCATGQIGIGIRAIASNGGTLIGGVGLICGNPMSQGNQDVRAIKPNALSAGTVYTYTCAAGQLLAGFYLRTGSLVDQITPKCSTFSGFSFAAVGAPTATVTGNTASVSFATVSGNIADTALTYTVSAVPNTGPTITVTGSGSPIAVPGLVLRSNYNVTVSASNAYGSSAATSSTSAAVALPGSDTDTALYFDGTDYVKVADSNEVDFTNAFTFQAWVKPETMTSYGMILNKEDSIEFYISGGYYGIAAQKALNQWGYFQTGVPAVVGEWHHIAYTRAANSTTVSVYLDGYLAWSGVIDTDFTSTPLNTSYPLMIGGRSGSASGVTFDPSFKGMIDHVAVYSAVRTQSQIQSDMNSYIAPDATDLLLYYDFNEGTGTTLYNRKSGSTSASDLLFASTSPTWTDVKEVSTPANSPYTIIKFPRTYITVNGGWRVPANVTRVTALVVAGGGGGGSRHAGGGGAGGIGYGASYPVLSNQIYQIQVGRGGAGYGNIGNAAYVDASGSLVASKAGPAGGIGGKGEDSVLRLVSSSTESITALGGGGGSGTGATGAGGSGGGSNQSVVGGTALQYSGPNWVGYGNNGGQGSSGTCASDWCGGGGGGAGGPGDAGRTGTDKPGNGGEGKSFDISGSLAWYAGGGGGGSKDGASVATGGLGGGGNGGNAAIGQNAVNGTGGGGGGGGFSGSTDYRGGNGASGVIIIRWITALKPTFTPPSNAYLNVGMTETFTVNVPSDSSTVGLTRTFRWESTTGGSGGTYSLIKQGTGAANAYFAWVPTDTSTSGANYLYRVIVTDSDTAGLFIVETSTAVYAVINRALVVSGTTGIAKTINVAKSETFTITLGTSIYRSVLSPTIPGITLDTSTAGIAIVKISETMTVGTYYETLTVTDSVSAQVVTPLTIVVAAPPTFVATSEIVDSGTVLYLEAGNSNSYDGSNSWKDLSGRGLFANMDLTNGGAPATANGSTTTSNEGPSTCQKPLYSQEALGSYQFVRASKTCGYVSNFGYYASAYTVQVWLKRDGTQTDWASIVASPWNGGTQQIHLTLHWKESTKLEAGVYSTGINPGWTSAKTTSAITDKTWVLATLTFDGVNISLQIDNGTPVTATSPITWVRSNNQTGLLIGKRFDSDGLNYFNGSIASIRIYNRVLTPNEIQSNYLATRNRFQNSDLEATYPSQKYGNTTLETFTATSGYGSTSITLSTGSKSGVVWSTAPAVTTLRMTETLTATTHYDTITVTDSLGQSTYLPIKMTVSKADTLTISMDTATVITYNGSPITAYPKQVFKGLAGVDTLTVTTKFSSSLYPKSATVPTNSDTYTVIGEDPVFGIGALSNYVNVVYETSTAVVNKAKQPALSVFLYGGTVGSAFPITVTGGGGDGAISETVTAGGTMTGCSISNHVLTASSSNQGFCRVYIVKALSQNYLSESITVDMYFMAYLNYQPSGQVGSGATIAINGSTSLTIDDTSTVRAPNITSLSLLSGSVGTTIHIYGGNFGAGPLTIKFYRNKIATGTVASGSDITVTVPSGATTGPILVITANGEATTPTFTVMP